MQVLSPQDCSLLRVVIRLLCTTLGISLFALPLHAQEAALLSEGACIGVIPAKPLPIHPAADGHLVITGNADAFVLGNQYVDILPPMNKDMNANQYQLEINGQIQRKSVAGDSFFPTARINGWQGALGRRRVHISYQNIEARSFDLLTSVLHNSAYDGMPAISSVRQNEDVLIKVPGRAHLSALYLFEGETLIGELDKNASLYQINTRVLAPGQHNIYVVAQNEEGIFYPATDCSVTISQRYRMSIPTGQITIDEHTNNPVLKIPITRLGKEEISTTQVYLDGVLVFTSDQPSFEATIPVKDVPSGRVELDVVGRTKDGAVYAAESGRVLLANGVWSANNQYHDDFNKIQDDLRYINEMEKDAAMWLEKAAEEPAFHEQNSSFTRTYATSQRHLGGTPNSNANTNAEVTDTVINTLRTPGHSKEYINNARKDIKTIAQTWLQISTRYERMNLIRRARRASEMALRKAGADSALGIRAAQMIQTLPLFP